MPPPADVRPSPLAGRWYPAHPGTLQEQIGRFFENASRQSALRTDPDVLALLAPHAGLRYSGPVAAYAFAALKGLSFDTVVILGPLHYALPLPPTAGVLTTDHDGYETPLGVLPVDRELLGKVGQAVPLTALRADPEHSIEIELPFLQLTLRSGFRIAPIMLRDQSEPTARRLGESLAQAIGDRRVLLVASSDLSHFYPQPIAVQLDHMMLSQIEAMHADQVIALDEAGKAFACGRGAIAAVIYALKAVRQPKAHIVRYATSGDVSGDYAEVVGYGAALFR